MNIVIKFLSSTRFFAILLFVTAFFMGLATFVENDFGTVRAKELIYNAWWFEVILTLLAINLIAIIFTKKLYKLKKIPVFLFHFAFVIMLIGAAVTRYVGYEGTMHIREKEESAEIETQKKGLTIKKQGSHEQKFINIKFDELKTINKNFTLDNKSFNIKIKQYYDNAYPMAVANKNGMPIIGFIVSSNGYKNFSYIALGQKQTIDNFSCSFGDTTNNMSLNFFIKHDSIYVISKRQTIWVSDMGKKANPIKKNTPTLLIINKLYQIAGVTIIVKEILHKAIIVAKPLNKNENKISAVAELSITQGQKEQTVQVWEYIQSIQNKAYFDNTNIECQYGKRIVNLPFSIYLNKFEVKHYPGSNSPSSFSSYVTINKDDTPPTPFHIYMNNVLKTDGFRFFQSSYDKDEKGTILSVNYDIWGTTITYIGYFLLFLGIILSLLSKHTLFRNIGKTTKIVLLTILLSVALQNPLLAHKNTNLTETTISKAHAKKFSTVLIQDNNGRTEPIYTFASDLVRKLSRSESLYGLTPVQTFLEMNLDPKTWSEVPIIKITNKQLRTFLNLPIKYASYNNFVSQNGDYVLRNLVTQAYAKPSAKRSKFDKAVLKADERVNICYSIFSGNYFKIFPQIDSADNSHWLTLQEVNKLLSKDSTIKKHLVKEYFNALQIAKTNNNYVYVNNLADSIKQYQKTHANYKLPTDSKIKAEIIYYKWNIFKKLFPFYATIGVLFLAMLVISIIKNKKLHKNIIYTFYAFIGIGFLAHTIGIAIRWYISGHAPMSNGYESMIFISWVTVLAGFIFSKKSQITVSATSVLAGMTLMVANLSFMDPVITNLVPVLQSYWLTLHVSVITGSYAFLGLGAILGLINQILFIAQTSKNKNYIISSIKNLTDINHKTLILGLYFLTIGTFLGAIWANESWGRYWGWDPKETWSLITIIVYTFVTHSRMIPGFKGVFMFNLLSLYGISSVLMTYFGVNYYLSGMHSYAGGDPVPVPAFVYYTIAILITISAVAWSKTKKQII